MYYSIEMHLIICVLDNLVNSGNFLELLSFLGEYVPRLKNHLLKPSALNATHLSPLIIDSYCSKGRRGVAK